MLLQRTAQQIKPHRKILLNVPRKPIAVHRIRYDGGTVCGCELSNPITFEGTMTDVTCRRCANQVPRRIYKGGNYERT